MQPWDDPNIIEALKERPATEISIFCCPRCQAWNYYNDGSHASCYRQGCGWFADGDMLEAMIDQGDVITLEDWLEGQAEPGPYL